MDFSITPEELSRLSLFICTPMFGGQCAGEYRRKCLELTQELMRAGVNHAFGDIYNESLIPRARNKMAHDYLKARHNGQPFTHSLWWDSDIVVEVKDILFMLAWDREVVVAPYSRKKIDWPLIKQAILEHPDIPPDVLASIGGNFAFNFDDLGQYRLDEPFPVREAGTGMMMVKRIVYEAIQQRFPDLEYDLSDDEREAYPEKTMWAFFESHRPDGETRYFGEDYVFCRRARACGFPIWLCPFIATEHIGSYNYKCDLRANAKWVKEL